MQDFSIYCIEIACTMIRYNSQRQLTLEGFETPFEMNLDPPDRWVKYANELPWDDLVKVYCRKMSSKMGAGAKDPRVVIGAAYSHFQMACGRSSG